MISRGTPCDATIQSETINKRLEWIKSTIQVSHHARILDLGCGKGVYDSYLSEIGMNVVGIDIERLSLMECKSKNGSSIEYILGEAERIPVQNEAFDAIICIEVLEHVADLNKTVLEMNRVLKSKGALVVTVPNRGFPFLTHGFHLGKRYYNNFFGIPLPLATYLPMPILKHIWRARHFRAKELKEFIERNGFSVTDIRFLSPAFDTIGGRVINKDSGSFQKSIRGFFRNFDLNEHFWPGLSIAFIAIRK